MPVHLNLADINWEQVKKDFDASVARHLGIKPFIGQDIGFGGKMSNVESILQEATALFKQRAAVYGNNAPKTDAMARAIFPEGVTLSAPKDFIRFYLLMVIASKLSRYGNNFHKGGHADSLTDIMVYAAMLQAEDETC